MSVMRHRRTNATSLIVIVASSFVAQDPLVTAGESPGRAGIPSVDAWSFYHRRGAVFFASQQYSMPMSQSGQNATSRHRGGRAGLPSIADILDECRHGRATTGLMRCSKRSGRVTNGSFRLRERAAAVSAILAFRTGGGSLSRVDKNPAATNRAGASPRSPRSCIAALVGPSTAVCIKCLALAGHSRKDTDDFRNVFCLDRKSVV